MTIINRVSTHAVFSNTLRNVGTVQANLFNLQDQVSSEVKTKNFKGLSGQVEQFTFLEAKIRETQNYEEHNAVAVSRLETMNVALTQIEDIDIEIVALMTAWNGVSKDDIGFEEQMGSYLNAIASELNMSFEGRYLFGGTRTNVPPVINDPQVPGPIEFGTLDAGYYQGSNEDIVTRASDNVDITANIRADDPAFQKLFHAVFLSLEAHATNDQDLMLEAKALALESREEIGSVIARNNTNKISLESINERHSSLRLYWQGVTEQVIKTDPLAASTQMAVDRAVLQASFQAFAGINQLRLTDYL